MESKKKTETKEANNHAQSHSEKTRLHRFLEDCKHFGLKLSVGQELLLYKKALTEIHGESLEFPDTDYSRPEPHIHFRNKLQSGEGFPAPSRNNL